MIIPNVWNYERNDTLKIICKQCGIVDKPHKCPKIKRKIDRERTDNKVYESNEYRSLRREILEDYNYLCLWSLYIDGRVKEAEEVHHIIEILEDELEATEYDNLIPLRKDMHDKVHKLYKLNNNIKRITQELLRKMCEEYRRGNREPGALKDSIPPSLKNILG